MKHVKNTGLDGLSSGHIFMMTSRHGNPFRIAGTFHWPPVDSLHSAPAMLFLTFSLLLAWTCCQISNKGTHGLKRPKALVALLQFISYLFYVNAYSGIWSFKESWNNGDAMINVAKSPFRRNRQNMAKLSHNQTFLPFETVPSSNRSMGMIIYPCLNLSQTS